MKKRRLVTVIEFLSPTNKRGTGRREYLKKRERILTSTTHLLEIDLLRNGKRVPMQEPLPAAANFIFLCRAEKRARTEVWPIRLDQVPPTVPVPLLPPDSDVLLDMQQAFTSVYDLCGFDLAVDYAEPPDVPLPPRWEPWAQSKLRSATVRFKK